MTSWQAPRAPAAVNAAVALPGSKSLTNRWLVLAALADGPGRLIAPLRARDTLLMADALRALGATITDDGLDWTITPGALHGATVDCGLAGTVMRFVPPVAALADGDSVFDGDPAARVRPMHTLIDALRRLGADVDDGGSGTLPFRLKGMGRVKGGTVEIDASASSQFVSALLLAGARFDHGLELRHVGKAVPSLPHIDMTVGVLRACGVHVDDQAPDRWAVAPGPIHAPDVAVEPDLSNAAPFLAAALVTGGTITVPRWPAATTQPGDRLRDLLAQMGAAVQLGSGELTVKGGDRLGPLVADLHDVGELTPVLAALCALADGESVLSGIAHLRGHETDRLAGLQAELTGLGGDVRQTDDGLQIRPTTLHAGTWHAYDDHRMATAGAVLGLAVAGVEVDDIGCTSKTLPRFSAMWSAMLDA